MKKRYLIGFTATLLAATMAGCSSGTASTSSTPSSSTPATSSSAPGSSAAAPSESAPASDFDTSRMITVVSREDGSGTRGAFIELMGIQEKTADGGKVDKTTKEAVTVNKTDVMLTTVSGDEYAIGYVSLGSLSDAVKALDIDGAQATAENVKNSSYKVSRPFNIATKGEASGLAKDFIDFIMSTEGQQVVEDSGYIKIADSAAAFAGSKPEGKITVAGSSSVAPVMEKLKEAYVALNPAASIEIQQSDSTAGMTAAVDGTCDIGMASRELKDTELTDLTAIAIANDGIAIITSTANPLTGITTEQVKQIFTGEIEVWSDVK